jgi:hypothetical protein
MSPFASVTHGDWIAAPPDLVRAQFADLQHHIDAGVHPKLSFRPLPPRDGCMRYEQVVRLLGLAQRDVFERRFDPDGTMTDTSVEGFNRGGSLQACFRPGFRNGRPGTEVTVTVRLPLPPLVGPLLRPLLEAQVRRELRTALAEDKNDLEVRGYRRAPLPTAA